MADLVTSTAETNESAKIKPIFQDGELIYPISITRALYDTGWKKLNAQGNPIQENGEDVTGDVLSNIINNLLPLKYLGLHATADKASTVTTTGDYGNTLKFGVVNDLTKCTEDNTLYLVIPEST